MTAPATDAPQTHQMIGTLNEKPLHAALKTWYARPGDRFEVSVDGFVIDIVQNDLLVEIQTRNFAAIKNKLISLSHHHPIRLVHPIAREKWIIKLGRDEHSQQSRRKSPKRGTLEHVFEELVSFPALMASRHFSLHILLIQEEELCRRDDKRRWRRRGWITHERRLIRVVDQRLFKTPSDLCDLLPISLAEPFTTSDLATAISQPRRLAQKMAYCLREMDAITAVGKRGRAILYVRAPESTNPHGRRL